MNFRIGFTSVSAVFRGAQLVWPTGTISVTSGTGYAGSVYSSAEPGQWYANDIAIPQAVGATWTMTVPYEGASIRCGESNTIRMWVPTNLSPSTYLTRRRVDTVTVSGGYVTSWSNLGSSAGALSQVMAANQPIDNVVRINGQPSIRFSRGDGLNCGLVFPYSLAPEAKTVVLIGKATGETIPNRTVLGGGTSVASNNVFLPLAQGGSSNPEYVRNFSGLDWRVNGELQSIATRGAAYTSLLNAGVATLHEIYTSAQAAYTDSALLGYGATGAFSLGLDVAEVIIVDGALSAAQRASLTTYANAIYGIVA